MNIKKIFLFICFASCKSPAEKLSFQVFQSASGFGYAILREGKQIIYQPHIPGVDSVHGFADSAKAAKTASFVIKKIVSNQWPPSVNIRELDSLGITGD